MTFSVAMSPRTFGWATTTIGLMLIGELSCAADDGGVQPSVPPVSPLTVTCAADHPVAHPGESVTLIVWVSDGSGQPVVQADRYTWTVSSGTVSGDKKATWALGPDVSPSQQAIEARATVVVRVATAAEAQCEVALYVAEAPKVSTVPRSRLEARAFLLPMPKKEPKGYGLYSYLLFQTAPRDDVERNRYLKALEAYLLVFRPTEEAELYRLRSELNLTLVPVRYNVTLPVDLSNPATARKAAETVLAAYDHARAQDLLDSMGRAGVKGGPYLFSRMPTDAKDKTRVFFDMSRVEPQLVFDWVQAFSWLTAEERSWSQAALDKLARNTRNVVAVTARSSPEVLGALMEWIKVFK